VGGGWCGGFGGWLLVGKLRHDKCELLLGFLATAAIEML